MINILFEYLKYRQHKNADEYLFCTGYGRKLGAKSAGDALTRYCNARGVVSLGHHAFRHTFAKISVRDCNIDVFRLQRLLGHSDIKTTEHYVNLYSADLLKDRDTFNPLEHLLDSKQKAEMIRVGKGGKR
jgi:integrase/recombinase XerD